MTDPLFLTEFGERLPGPGDRVELAGPEGHHAAAVRRLRLGESVILSDGGGRGVRGPVVQIARHELMIEVAEVLSPPDRSLRVIVAQALAKGDRSELAIEMLTEVGADEIWPWQSQRSIVRWSGERAEKSRARWQGAAREAAKQSRRLRIPPVAEVQGTADLARRLGEFDRALILHEDADQGFADVEVPTRGSLLIMVGPEGGIAPEELRLLTEQGGRPVRLGDGVLRTSTAGVVAVAGVLLR